MRRPNLMPIGAAKRTKDSSKLLFPVAVILLAVSTATAAEAPSHPATTTPAGEPRSSRELVINIPDRKLALLEDGKVVKVYSVAVGAPGTPTPEGHFKIINRLVKPTYYHKGHVIRPGRANPLGNRWMGLDLKGYGIHGTNEPRSIGHAASHGCIRMGKKDVENLFRRVQVGDVVVIYNEVPAQLASVFEPQSETGTQTKVAAEGQQQPPSLQAKITAGI